MSVDAPPVAADVETALSPSAPPTRPAWRRRTLVGLLFIALVLLMLRPNPGTLTDTFPDLGDPVLTAWTQSWSAHALLTDPLHLFDANIFWPHGYALAYTDAPLVLVPFFGTLRLFGASEALAINLIGLVSFGVALAGTYALSRWLTGRTDAAILAAIAFTFGAYTFAQASHVNLLLLGLLPIGFLLLFRLLDERTTRSGVLLGLVNVAILLGSLYYAAIYVVCVVTIVAGFLVTRRARPRAGLVRPLLVAGAITLVALPFLWPYFALENTRELAPDWGLKAPDLVTPAPGSYLYDSLDESAATRVSRIEHTYFPGFGTVALGLVGLGAIVWASAARRRSRPHGAEAASELWRGDRLLYLWLLLGAATASVVLSLGPEVSGVPMPFRLFYEYVPGFEGIRVTARLAVVGLLALAVLAAVGFAALTGRWRRAGVALAAVAVGGFLLLELAAPTRHDHLPTDDSVLAVYDALDRKPDGAVVELPAVIPQPDRAAEIAVVEGTRMLYATHDWKPRFNGYSGGWPDGYAQQVVRLNTFPSPDALALMRRLEIRYVILHVGKYREFPQLTEAQAAAAISELPPGSRAERHGDAWLVDLAPAG